jgi:ATP-dependent DNA helicase RecQ
MSSFAQLKATLRTWPAAAVPTSKFHESAHERLRLALMALKEGSFPFGPGDLASLIRNSLRFEAAHGGYPKLAVPSDLGWPNNERWALYGCRTTTLGSDFVEVEAASWHPSWLAAPPFDAAEKRVLRRENLPVPTDPALSSRYKRDYYLSHSQAETVRGVMLSPPGSVRLVILPTGAGKSLVGLSAALLGAGESGGVSIFVIPTIALADDQVRQARELCEGAQIDAWHSGQTSEVRKEIMDRLTNGTQRVLFAAPESIVSSLSEALYKLAKSGVLRAFVVDEAHLVGQWGTSFRPEFQSMAALWRQLRAQRPREESFRTVLMTATLTEESFADIRRFYGSDDDFETLAAVHLRPEPVYIQVKCDDETQRTQRVIEALRHSPRPAILYVTEIEHAKRLHQRCLEEGWLRTGLMHGGCAPSARDTALQAWNRNEIDVMVATSAFGLGMDKDDVRVVLHACVPETLDRFYQEVGRGGRDGCASVSMMLWVEADARIAERMSSPQIIGEELGAKRWRTMWSGRRSEEEMFLVNLRALRPGIDWDSERNIGWNLKTILLLARAGVLQVEHRSLAEVSREANESDEAFHLRREALRDEHQALCPIRLLQPNPLTDDAWESQVGTYRDRSKTLAAVSWNRMEAMLRGKRSLVEILREVYLVPSAGIHDVATEARGLTIVPPRVVCDHLEPPLRDALSNHRGEVLLVTYRTAGMAARQMFTGLVEVLKRLARNGIREFALPTALRNAARWPGFLPNPLKSITAVTRENFLIVRELDEDDPLLHGSIAVPRVTLIPPHYSPEPVPSFLFLLRRPAHLIIVPEECRDHRNPSRRVGEVAPPDAVRLEDFQRVLKQ